MGAGTSVCWRWGARSWLILFGDNIFLLLILIIVRARACEKITVPSGAIKPSHRVAVLHGSKKIISSLHNRAIVVPIAPVNFTDGKVP
ncbi:hypothetical protein Aduo_000622 [Ancylostoma duodenale]